MRLTTKTILTTTVHCVVVALLAVPVSIGATRDDTVSVLSSIPSSWESAGLEAWLNDARFEAREGETASVVLGAPKQYHVRSSEEMFLTLVHVNVYGQASVVFADPARKLGAGIEAVVPEDGEDAVASLPTGMEDLFVFGTKQPIRPADLGLAEAAAREHFADEEEAGALVNRVRERLSAAGPVAVARVPMQVNGRSKVLTRGAAPRPDYTAEEIVAFFTSPRTRALKRPRLDPFIQFEVNEANLTPASKASLREWGKALSKPQLEQLEFVVAGHTCDLGPDSYNLRLSRERAASVIDYLSREFGISPERLDVQAKGESEPLVANSSEASRQQNRRVEFRVKRGE